MDILKKILLLPLLVLLLSSCIKDNLDDCGRLDFRLQFSFTLNNQHEDLLADEVRNIRVYVFDQVTGLLVDMINVTEQDIARGYIDVDLLGGRYTFVAWGSNTNITNGGYAAAGTVGQTTLNDFRMTLATASLPSGSPYAGLADVVPQTAGFGDLFWAIAKDVTVLSSGRDQSVDFDLIRNTNTLTVNVAGLENLSTRALTGMELDVFTVGRNWLYGNDNNLFADTPRMLFLPHDGNRDEAGGKITEVFNIRQQRLSQNPVAARPILYVRDAATNTALIPPLDVVYLIQQMKDDAGNPLYPNQGYIDREDTFLIDIEFRNNNEGNLVIRISVKGWTMEYIYSVVA
ncbi:MAG: FimB/Mfa2 family fimbrial subunit [Dysgonamonadaceae bacterium]|jgi:hypothetical protein|nr:FimB/Mfa2 family fimbrial subunit [Dysgonamonadaceae bacterium]